MSKLKKIIRENLDWKKIGGAISPKELTRTTQMDLVEIILRNWCLGEKPKYFDSYEREKKGFLLVIVGKAKKYFLEVLVVSKYSGRDDGDHYIRIDVQKDNLSNIENEIKSLIRFHLTKIDGPILN